MDTVDVETTHGKVRGFRARGVSIFKGIPYAGSVSGERRFLRPAELAPWRGARDATRVGAPAIQPPRNNEPDPAEDCLFLNIWTPACDNHKRPVMFYNHGGGYVIGSGASPLQDGANLARNFDVVVVQTNHRLGLLGFLYLEEIAGADYAESANQGLLDITAGLRWVRANISAFGGDPANVMIFGESGGGAKTACLYAMPEAAPFFNKASIESGPGVRMLTRADAARATAQVLQTLDIAPRDWRKLLSAPAADLLRAQMELPFVPPFLKRGADSSGLGPLVDGVVLPAHPFDPAAPAVSAQKPLLVGWNEDEYTFFAWERKDGGAVNLDFTDLEARLIEQYAADAARITAVYRQAMPGATAAQVFIALASFNMMGLGSIEIAERKAAQGGAPVYLYQFGYQSEVKIPGTAYPLGAAHALDITFKFNNETPDNAPWAMSGSRPERFAASRHMAGLWTSFARGGTPAAPDTPAWPPFDPQRRASLRIDSECRVIANRHSAELALWRAING